MKFFRMPVTLALAIVLALFVAALAPQQLPVTAYKLSLITIAALVAYWIDREIFPYARPDRFLSDLDRYCVEFCFSMLRRAIIVAAVVIAVALGA